MGVKPGCVFSPDLLIIDGLNHNKLGYADVTMMITGTEWKLQDVL